MDRPAEPGISTRPGSLPSREIYIERFGRGQRLTLYVDSSALLKRYVSEHDSAAAITLMKSDPVLVTSRLTEIEVRRNIARLLHDDTALVAKEQFAEDLDAFALIHVDATTCNQASRVAEQTLCRSLDAIHIAAALRAGPATTLLTFDTRQAQAARACNLNTIGV